MRTLGAYEAKTHFAQLLDRVARGEKITITKHGVPIAMLVPLPARQKADVQEVIEAIKQLRRGNRLGGLSIRDTMNEGRK